MNKYPIAADPGLTRERVRELQRSLLEATRARIAAGPVYAVSFDRPTNQARSARRVDWEEFIQSATEFT